MNLADKAEGLFTEGYNCAQAVFGAIAVELGMDKDTAMKIASSMGGGMGRMREVCGACSGLFMGAGLSHGYSDPECGKEKAEHYALIRELAEEFKAEHGSIICREILDKQAQVGGTPEARTPEYYAKRPCARVIASACQLIDEMLEEKNHA